MVDLVPMIKAALAIDPSMDILASPWTAPAWMKTSPPGGGPLSLDGGSLNPADFPVYGEYLTRFVQAYAAHGIRITALTMQDEPDDDEVSYPGMTLTADQEAELAPLLGRDLAAAGLHTQILGFDSDWADAGPYAEALLGRPRVAKYISGLAFHCYSGSPSAQLAVRAEYPGTPVYETECSGYESVPGFAANLINGTSNLVIDSVRDGAKAVLFWNLVLDQDFGPTNGGCEDCVPNVTVDSVTGAVTYNVENDVLAQVSPYVVPGAFRVGSTDLGAGSIETVAFENPDGSNVLVVLNTATVDRSFVVRWDGRSFTAAIPAGAVQTFTWR